jgi:DNA modification methylase
MNESKFNDLIGLHRIYGDNLHSNAQKIKESIEFVGGIKVKKVIGEFWTSKQRQASTLQEVSYRACFKPQLPNYFINKYTQEGDVVYDPFGGRGTTVIEAALLGRKVIQNDINPISTILSAGRLPVPTLRQVEERLANINFNVRLESDIDLSMFYEERTLNELLHYQQYFVDRLKSKTFDSLDAWIRMIATNRLTGHSPGFFSVYTLPPNQAVSAERQIKINQKLDQIPNYRDTKKIILKKTKQLLSGLTEIQIKNLHNAYKSSLFLTKSANNTDEIKSNSVSLIVTSPPFLDIVQYIDDNWLRCWFNSINAKEVGKNITMSKTVEDWSVQMQKVLRELHRMLKPNGVIAFEVGEVRSGTVRLDEVIAPLGQQIGLACEYIMINSQSFTKTSNIWGVGNNKIGTNSNRIVIFRKE